MENFYKMPTVTLLQAMDQIKSPATYLVDQFFKNKMPVANSSMVAVEYRKGKRLLAPFITRGTKGVHFNRQKADARIYSAPMTGGRRTFSIQELELRQFGEQPLYSSVTPQERAAKMIADDLRELTDMIYNRRNKIAADILVEGKTLISGYDENNQAIEDEIDFNFTNKKSVAWKNSATSIYKDLREGCDKIAEGTGTLPKILLCGKNVEDYLLKNAEIKDWLLISNNKNLNIASIEPKYLAPQVRYLGYLPSLGLEIYSYLETYYDAEAGQVQPFIPADTAILLSPDTGDQLFGAISLVERNSGVVTYASEIVPQYQIDDLNQQISLSVYSRCLLVPRDVDSWFTFSIA